MKFMSRMKCYVRPLVFPWKEATSNFLFVISTFRLFVDVIIMSITEGEEGNRKWVAVEHDAFVLYHR